MTAPEFAPLPHDAHNTLLAERAHPGNWINPSPAKRYNLVVVGAGTAGLVAAAGAAGLGGRVALVERGLMGGDCLNYGCVPSKAVIGSARAAHAPSRSAELGVNLSGSADFGRVMERMRRLRAQISMNDSAGRFQGLGVDVFLGEGVFAGPDSIRVGDAVLRFTKAVIATGARPSIPPIDGLAEAGYVTNETVFSLTDCPRRFTVIGGGPIGCELAQAFGRLGAEVTIIQNGPQFLPREDPDAAELLADTFRREGIRVVLGASITRVESHDDGSKTVRWEIDGSPDSCTADTILIAAGRTPNVEGLGLDPAGVAFDPRSGVVVDDFLRTSNKRIYAAGDVCLGLKFTHLADATARIVLKNALFNGRNRLSDLTVPWCTYTDPEIAHTGMYERDAAEAGIAIDTFTRQFSEVDRAICDSDEAGFVKIHVKRGTDRILGATIVGSHAGDMISELTLAITRKIGLGAIGSVIHPYPTRAEAIKQLGDAFARTRLTPLVASPFRTWLAWSRRG